MVATAEIQQFKQEIEESLINQYANDITLKSEGTKTYDDWGEPVLTGQVSTATIGVTDQYTIKRMRLSEFGRLPSGDLIIIIKADETVDNTYTVVIEGIEYNILGIELLKAANVTVAKIISLGSK